MGESYIPDSESSGKEDQSEATMKTGVPRGGGVKGADDSGVLFMC